jgi:hypothetical protein
MYSVKCLNDNETISMAVVMANLKRYYPGICLDKPRMAMNNISHNNQCPGQDSNGHPPKCKVELAWFPATHTLFDTSQNSAQKGRRKAGGVSTS